MRPAPKPKLDSARRAFVLCYAASGAAALVYQVAWMRLFSLQLGHSVAASSTVLAAFMGGLVIGSWIAGRRLILPQHALRAYAALEAAIAAAALVLPFLLPAVTPVLAWAYADGSGGVPFAMTRVGFSLLLLGVPACAMGATFPISVTWLASMPRTARRKTAEPSSAPDAGLLYAANSTGAAAGAIAAGFWLIPILGLRGTTWIGVLLNLAAAAGAYWLSTQHTSAEPAQTLRAPADAAPADNAPAGYVAHPHIAAAAAGLSGFLALVYEVTWTRLIALIIGPTTYAFATMAASFIGGIALGSMLGTRIARRSSRPGVWLVAALAFMAASAEGAAWFAASRLPLIFARDVAGGAEFTAILSRELFYIVALLLPTSFASGLVFILSLAIAKPGVTAIARETAHVYATNTMGAVTGALGAGFLLIPWLGLQSTFSWMTRAGLIGAAVIAFVVLGRKVGSAIAAVLLGLAIVQVLPDWDRNLLASGPYKYGRFVAEQNLDDSLRAGRLEYYKEGAAGTVSVRRLGGSLALAIDGKVDASNAGDMLTQRMLGFLPMLLHPQPRDVLVIGLGSGVTASSALAVGHDVRADVVEISPQVVEASAFFAKENGNVLKSPAVRLLVGDGRSHLLLGKRQYDVIVSEPSNPWMAGVASLFTREFFEAARARLNRGGILCQWAHTYEIAEDDLKSIAATFASVFPQGTMWLVGDGDLLLIGRADGDIEQSLSNVAHRLAAPGATGALADLGIAPASAPFVVLSLFAGGPKELALFGRGAGQQTDDRMTVEFTAVRAMYSRAGIGNTERIRALLSDAAPPSAVASVLSLGDSGSWTARGHVALKAGAFEMARDSFRRAITLDTKSSDALRGLSEAAAGRRQLAAEIAWLRDLAAAEPRNVPVRIELSHTLASSGNADGAIAAAMEGTHLEPENPQALEQLASVYADAQDAARLTPLAETLVAKFPARADSRYYFAASLFLRGRPYDAADEARQALLINPVHAAAQNLLGAACAARGDFECARNALEAAVRLSPRDASPLTNLGFLALQAGNPAQAAAYFAEAIAVDPESDAARNGLVQARARAIE